MGTPQEDIRLESSSDGEDQASAVISTSSTEVPARKLDEEENAAPKKDGVGKSRLLVRGKALDDGKAIDKRHADSSSVADSNFKQRLSRTAYLKFGKIKAMPEIIKSPYEPNQSAEVGESLFDQLKLLFISQEELQGELHDLGGSPTLTVQPETLQLFGNVIATSLVKASHVIGKSGMLFSPPWLDSKNCKIRGSQIGWISPHMMLLLLQEQRFAVAEEVVLQSAATTLGVNKFLFDALKEWKLEKVYPRLMCNAPTLQFEQKKKICLKCAIFVARTYRCTKVLLKGGGNPPGNPKKSSVSYFVRQCPSLYAKVIQCLDIISAHVKVNEKRLEEIEAARAAKKKKIASQKFEKALQEAAVQQAKEQQESSFAHQSSLGGSIVSRAILTEVEEEGAAVTETAYDAMDDAPMNSMSGGRKPRATTALDLLPVDRLQQEGQERQASMAGLLRRAAEHHKALAHTMEHLQQKLQEDRQQLKEELRRELRTELLQELGRGKGEKEEEAEEASNTEKGAKRKSPATKKKKSPTKATTNRKPATKRKRASTTAAVAKRKR